jgi:biotin carboxyl carrier protein
LKVDKEHIVAYTLSALAKEQLIGSDAAEKAIKKFKIDKDKDFPNKIITMANLKITVPDMGDFKDVEVIEVLVKEGQSIDKNESIITLESDKSSVEVPSTHSGKVDKISIAVGDKINKGDLILTLESSEKKEEEKKLEPKKENKVEKIIPSKAALSKGSGFPCSSKWKKFCQS